MAKIRRKSRNKIAKNFNLLMPVDITKLGSEDDPCFGKHYKPSCSECSRCGDSELCAIAVQQRNFAKRNKVESEGKFKDLEEGNLVDIVSKLELKKQVKARIRELIKMSGSKGIDLDYLVNEVHSAYFRYDYTKDRIGKLVKIMEEKSGKFTLTKNTLKWKGNK